MKGEWAEVVTLNMRAEEVVDAMSQHCDLDEHMAERLKMNCVPHTRNGKKETKTSNRNVMMGEGNEDKTGWRKGTIAFE